MVGDWSGVIGGAIGVLGAVIGAAVNELLRRSSRIEGYSAPIFEKRLAAYEALLARMHEGYDVASEVMTNATFTPEQRHDAISVVIQDIARVVEANELFLDDDLTAHCVATFMGAEDAMAAEDEAGREAARKAIGGMYVEARRMIREDSGVAGVDRLLKQISRPRLSGDFINYLRTERRRAARGR